MSMAAYLSKDAANGVRSEYLELPLYIDRQLDIFIPCRATLLYVAAKTKKLLFRDMEAVITPLISCVLRGSYDLLEKSIP